MAVDSVTFVVTYGSTYVVVYLTTVVVGCVASKPVISF